MSKNIKLNETEYNGVSTVQLPTTDGGTATFKDTDEITTPTISVNASGLITASANGKSATHQLSSSDDADFVAENIAQGKTIFGLVGSLVASGGSSNEGTSGGAKIYNGVIESETGFATLEIEHNLGSKKLFWMISRDMTDYTPVGGALILACGITPNVFIPDIDINIGDASYNPWGVYSGNEGGYHMVGYKLEYKNSLDGLSKAVIEKVASTFLSPTTQTDNKATLYTGFNIASTIGKFNVTVIDLSSGQAVL